MSADPSEPRLAPETRAARALGRIDAATGAVVPPVHVATTFERAPDGTWPHGFVYARPDNPTASHTEAVLADLEGGAAAQLYGSGMAAATALILSLPRPARVLAPAVMYWALRRWLREDAPALGLETRFVAMDDLDAVDAAIADFAPSLIWAETPANPLWTISDIGGLAARAKAAGALLAVDSTVATPVFTRPLALGADVVMHSATKYLAGHSDLLAGALIFAETGAAAAAASRTRAALGAVLPGPEAALLLRSLRTLFVRVRRQGATAAAIAERLAGDPRIAAVLYPGLAGHPGHAVAARQMTGGFGGMVSIRLRGGAEAAIAAASRVRVFTRATSLGGVESLIEHRASVEGPGSPCPDDLLRLSIGLEDADDLLADLDRALG